MDERVGREKRLAAETSAELVEPGMLVGLGTGSTVAYLLPVLARRAVRARYVATSPETAMAAASLGLNVQPFETIDALDLAIDGADQVGPTGWLVKGGGGAHTREKIVAAAAERFVVIVSGNKLVEALGPPIPLELLAFGLGSTLLSLRKLGEVRLREAPRTPDLGVLADLWSPIGSPERLAALLSRVPGVVGHGLFPPEMVAEVIVGVGERVERRPGADPKAFD